LHLTYTYQREVHFEKCKKVTLYFLINSTQNQNELASIYIFQFKSQEYNNPLDRRVARTASILIADGAARQIGAGVVTRPVAAHRARIPRLLYRSRNRDLELGCDSRGPAQRAGAPPFVAPRSAPGAGGRVALGGNGSGDPR
jgi:hypothetical protein